MGNKDETAEVSSAPKQSTQMVKCDVCGRHYNQRYLTSHKRLSHERRKPNVLQLDETEIVERILSLFVQATEKTRKETLERLAAMEKAL